MSLEEFENTPDRKTKRYMQMKSILDLGMGILYIGIGVIIFFAKMSVAGLNRVHVAHRNFSVDLV